MQKLSAFGFFVVLATSVALAQRGPQDNWVEEPDLVWGSEGSAPGEFRFPLGAAVIDDEVFIVDSHNHRVQVFGRNGDYRSHFGGSGSGNGQMSSPWDIDAFGGKLYLADTGNQRVQVFQADGTYITNWVCEVDGAPFGPIGIAVDRDSVFVSRAHAVAKFEHDGTFVKTWGELGSVVGEFYNPQNVAVDRTHVYVADCYNRRVQSFTKEGAFVWSWALPGEYQPWGVAADDASIYITGRSRISGLYAYGMKLWIFDKQMQERESFYWQAASSDMDAAAPFGVGLGNPYLYVTTYDDQRVRTFRRIYRTLGAVTENAIPLADILSVAQREGTYIMDIDYAVSDPDNSNLTVYAAAFVNPSNAAPGLAEFLPIRTLVDGTTSNIGPGIAAGSIRRLSWDMDADGVTAAFTDYGTLKPAILVRDDREPLDLHMLDIPAIGTNAALTINRAPLYDEDLLPLWFWMLASGAPDISLSTGRVYGVAGEYAGQVLAQGANTTAKGREFLFERLGYREATPGELQYAREATTPGSVTEREPRREPPAAGYRVNEFNFVTYPTNGWWVVAPSP